jgi:hypothetical protein
VGAGLADHRVALRLRQHPAAVDQVPDREFLGLDLLDLVVGGVAGQEARGGAVSGGPLHGEDGFDL